ncbi:MAG: DUF4153 domain-containing protein [Alphaproteobacteria bacterium]|nr:DUF4153 domain-containing protein [Alphaproteobacteria bacterium]
MPENQPTMTLRITLALTGALAGLSFWALFEFLPDQVDSLRLLMVLAAFLAAFFSGLLLMLGRISLLAAMRYAAVIAAVSALLLLWSSYRFDDVSAFFESLHPFVALVVLAQLPLSFAMAQEMSPQGWRDYESLFDNAWSIFVRSVTSWAFVGLFWLVIFLSDQLLSLVKFDYLGLVYDKSWIALPLSGLVLGLSLAVLNELQNVVATLRRLALHLLRLLLPLVALVVALFIGLVPFQGLDDVFGSFSAAGTMLVMAAGAVTLITAAVDGRDEDAARSPVMVVSARVLALLLPIIAGIAVFAIWERVVQYGWTPARFAAAAVSGIGFAYALSYGLSVLRGQGWRARVRFANRWLAVGLIGLAMLWLTPVLNVERISANSHVARFIDGRMKVADLDIWSLDRDWGLAGKAGLARIRALTDHPEQKLLNEHLARFDDGASRWALSRGIDEIGVPKTKVRLAEILPVRPAGAVLPEAALSDIPDYELERILQSCLQSLPDGRPGCALVLGSFTRSGGQEAGVLFWRDTDPERTEIATLKQSADETEYFYRISVVSYDGEMALQPAEALIAQVLNGDFAFTPMRLDALEIGGIQISPRQ